jgi:four helix bundle protein
MISVEQQFMERIIMLDFERLDVYRLAIEFIAFAYKVVEGLPTGSADLADQLKRASTSIAFNISEGSGRICSNDRARFHGIARGSAMECAAILDVMQLISGLDDAAHRRGKQMLGRIVSMLSKMARVA